MKLRDRCDLERGRVYKVRNIEITFNSDRCRPAPSAAIRTPMVDHDVRRSTRYIGGVGRNQDVISVKVDFSRRPHKTIAVKTLVWSCNKNAAVLLLANGEPVGHPQRVGMLALNFEIDFSLRIVHKNETG